MAKDKKQQKMPKAFRKPMESKRWEKKVMGKIFLIEDRDFLNSLKKESQGMYYIDPSDLDKKQIKRLKGLSKIIIANRKGLSFPLLVMGIIISVALLVWQAFLKDRMLTQFAEYQLEKIFQAQVEIKDLDASLFRASLSAKKLVIADRKNPMMNLVEIKDLEASLDPQQLTRGRIHISELGFRELQRGTEREESGAWEDTSVDEEPEERRENTIIDRISASLGQIDPSEILEQEMSNLKSPALAKKTLETYEQYQDSWEVEMNSWEGKVEEWEGSVAYVQSINPGSFDSLTEAQSTIERLNQIKNSAQEDLRKARKSFNEAQSQWEQAQDLYGEVEEAIRLDYQYLEGLISMSGGEKLDWISGILDAQMGSSISKYLAYWRQGRQWLDQLQSKSSKEEQPVETGTGRRIALGPETPPGFLLQHGYASGVEGDINYNIEIFNLNNAPDRWDSPVELKLNWDSPETGPVEAVISETSAICYFSQLHFDLKDSLESIGLQTVSGRASLKVDLQSVEDSIEGTLVMTIPEFQVVKEREDALSKALASALTSAKNTQITGTIMLIEGNLSMDIESELDELLNRALGNLLEETGRESARLLTEAFEEQLDGPLRELDQSLTALGLNVREMEDIKGSIRSLSNISDQKKKEIENQAAELLESQASDLLDNLPGGFF